MKPKYQLVRSSDPKGSEKEQLLHARVVSNGTIRLTDLMELGSSWSTFSKSDIKGALQLIADLLEEGLKSGHSVELDGIGFFSLSLECRPETDKKKIRSQSIRFRGVNFRLGKEMKHRLKGIQVYRQPERKQPSYTPKEREKRLWNYLSRKTFITTAIYMSLNSCTQYMALKELKAQIAADRLYVAGPRNNTTYLKREK